MQTTFHVKVIPNTNLYQLIWYHRECFHLHIYKKEKISQCTRKCKRFVEGCGKVVLCQHIFSHTLCQL